MAWLERVAGGHLYRGADKSLARPGRKQANVSVRMAWLERVAGGDRYRGADKSLARPVRKQANVSVRMAWLERVAGGHLYRGADKSLARPGRKQANVFVRMAWISFGALPCRNKNLLTARVSMLLKSCASPTCFRACFIPGWDKDLPAPL